MKRALLTLLVVGCGRDLLGADPEPTPDPAVRAVIEAPAPAAAAEGATDAQGRLRAADGLVQGFEVPRGLALVARRSGYLEFRIDAPIEALREFWSGLDRRTGNRFTERQYLLDDVERGFDVRHTSETARRLGLGDEAFQGYLYARPDRRGSLVRVHVPAAVAAGDAGSAFVPVVSDAPRGAPASPRPTPSPPAPAPARDSATGALQGSASAGEPPSARSSAPSRRAPTGPHPRYGPYATPGRSVAPEIRRWQAANPGETFVD